MEHVIDYSTILPEFCAARNIGHSYFTNGTPEVMTPRLNYIIQLLNKLNIQFEIDDWTKEQGGFNRETGTHETRIFNLYNIYLRGTSSCIVMAHHDIVNGNSDNCNDNSASVINAIAAKVLNPNLTVAIVDGEEFGGQGSQRLADRIKEDYFGNIDFVLNLELTAVGGTNFFTENYPNSPLFQKIQDLFPNTPTKGVPFHDGVIMRKNGIDSVVINPLPNDENGQMKMKLLYLCHSVDDSITLANYEDMDDFVRCVITPIVYDNCQVNNSIETDITNDTSN